MLGIFVMTGCVLMTCVGPPVNGYTLGTLSGGRGQEYNSGYRTGGFVAMKDSPGDYSDQTSSNRYSVVTSGGSVHPSNSASGYSMDNGYSDSTVVGAHTSVYGGAASNAAAGPDVTNGLSSSSSYTSDPGSHVASAELAGSGYSSSGDASSSSNFGNYATAGAAGSGGHGTSGYTGYTDVSGNNNHGGTSLSSSGMSGERGEYSASQHPSTSYVSYSVGGPKASAYTATSGLHGGHSHGPSSSYSSNPTYVSAGGHHRVPSSSSLSSSPLSSYPSDSGHSSYASVPPSLKSFLASMHNHGPSNYIPHSSGGHRGHHLFSSASNPSPSYSSLRGPASSNYYSNSPYPRGGGKIVIVKESNGGHPGHGSTSSMYPAGGEHSYSGGMFGGPGSGYKIRSVGSGNGHGPGSFPGGSYSSSGGYNGGSPHASNNHGASSFFSFL